MTTFDPTDKSLKYFSTITPGIHGCTLFEVFDKYGCHLGFVVCDFHGKPISGIFPCKWKAIAWINP